MIKQMLEESRRYEERLGKEIRPEERPKFHLSPQVGWMNDPNGFSYYNGQYHMFYQYYPYDTKWGPMHWGHAVSDDLLHWSYLPTALAPEEEYDKNGCFSGSAVEMPNGKHLLMYTGVAHEITDEGKHKNLQTQCLAIGDGLNYEKYKGNPVLDKKNIPKGGSISDFRDPKMWIKADGTYNCVVGNRSSDGSGQILLFSSSNGLEWKYEKEFVKNKNRFGKMWECPDFFELDGKGVLVVSPQEMQMKDYEFSNGNVTLAIIGSYDEETDEFVEENYQSLDYGIDFYATQTTASPDGRRIAIGWLQNWDSITPESTEAKWFGQMSIPRELTVRDGRLYQMPIRELQDLRKNEVQYQKVEIIDDVIQLDGINGRTIDMEISLSKEEMEKDCSKFEIHLAQDDIHFTSIKYLPSESMLELDRRFSGSSKAFAHQRSCLLRQGDDQLKLRIILDRFSVEIFVNDGEQVMSMTIYTEQSAKGISFRADGKAKIDVKKYDL